MLLSKIFDTGLYLNAWADGKIVPLLINGNVENVEKHSVIGKLTIHILNFRLSDWAKTYHVNAEAQSWFWKMHDDLG